MKIKFLILLFSIFWINGYNQSSPATPFDLSGGNYIFNNWPSGSAATSYPANAIFHRTGTNNPLLATPTNSNYIGFYNPTPGTARIDGLNGGGFAFSNDVTSSDHNLGAFVLALNTTGRTNIAVSFAAQGTSIGALYNVRLQYRISKYSAWVDVPGPIEFVGTGAGTAQTNFGPIALSTLTANIVDNRANLQLRWKYYYVSGAPGSPSKIRIDEINVSSTALVGNYTSVDSISSTPVCVTPTLGFALDVPVRCEPRANFTAGTTFTVQLSDASGSFASPITIGTATSSAAITGSQTILSCIIPPGTPYGTGYKIRVISNVAGFVAANASDNVVPFTIFLSPTAVTGFTATCASGSSALSWTLPTISCFNDVLIVANPNTSVAGSPSGNGSAYTANSFYGSGSAFGTGYVVYKGNGTSVNVTNLTNSVTYYFSIWVRYGNEWSLVSVVNCTPDFATKVVVNGYLNASNPNAEWTELLVTGDNVDMRGYMIRDNNSTQTGWQVPVTFANIPLWNNMRRGTVIMLWHRTIGRAIDINKDDGYLELELNPGTITPYFSGGDAANTLNLAASGDIVEVLAPGFVHVHGMGHLTIPGISWTGMPSPKLNHATGTADGDAVYTCPGGNIGDYDQPSGIIYTAKNNVTTTFGLPNTCGAFPTTNNAFWLSLRQPTMAPQTVTIASITPGMPGSVTFSWLPATDPYPADNTVGYIVLRDPTNVFSGFPQDGTTYTVGSALGTATIVGMISNSAISTFTDNTVMNGNLYYYRVYAFRYTTDNVNGNSFNVARGRAYNETSFVQVNWPSVSPLPVELISFTGKRNEKKIILDWHTASEENNDYFIIEKSTDGNNFEILGRVNGSGNSKIDKYYSLADLHPISGINYYALTQYDFNGNHSTRRIIAVRYDSNNPLAVLVFPNPFVDGIQFECTSEIEGNMEIKVFDYLGKLVYNQNSFVQEGYNHFVVNPEGLSSGVYFLEVQSKESIFRSKIVKK